MKQKTVKKSQQTSKIRILQKLIKTDVNCCFKEALSTKAKHCTGSKPPDCNGNNAEATKSFADQSAPSVKPIFHNKVVKKSVKTLKQNSDVGDLSLLKKNEAASRKSDFPSSVSKKDVLESFVTNNFISSNTNEKDNEVIKQGNMPLDMSEASSDNKTTDFDVSETFITIETKNGISSEKIPFSTFLKQVVIDKESGNLKIDFSQLIVSGSQKASSGQEQSISEKSAETTLPPDSEEQSEKMPFFIKPVKKRGRPPKNKQAYGTSSKEKATNSLPNDTSLSSAKVLPLCEPELHMQTKRDFSATPRRSSRTPAKNSRFGDDYVNSLTLGKVLSTSTPSWNTQLMTLALAAERHKHKPNKTSPDQTNGQKNQFDQPNQAIDIRDEEKTFLNEQEEKLERKLSVKEVVLDSQLFKGPSTTQEKTEAGTSVNSIIKAEEKVKKFSMRGPKTFKKYEPVDPVMKRTLQEALFLVTQATNGHLSVTKPNIENSDCVTPSVYYAIMEPKMKPTGHGLLVQKTEEKLNFRNVEFEDLPSSSTEALTQSYPQDRYFNCDLCDKIFISTNAWQHHKRQTHEQTECITSNPRDKQKHVCEFCHQSFPYKFMLDIHIKRKRHNEIKTFRCTLCKESFISLREREEHWMTHHSARSCSLCGKQFINIVMLRRHINNNCHGARFRKAPENESVNADDNMIVGTDTKGKLFLDQDRESHQGSMDNVAEETDNEDDIIEEEDDILTQVNEKARCNTCSLEFTTYSGLWHHKLYEHKEFYPEGFQEILHDKLKKNESILLSTSDVGSKPSESNRNKIFIITHPVWPISQPRLTISMEEKEFIFKQTELDNLQHNSFSDVMKETSFECTECSETFQFASNYREHRSGVHGECFEVSKLLGAFQCTLCSETFPCQFMLDKHTTKHNGKKVLPCTLCGLFFHKIQDRRQHWKTVHPGIGCPNCGKMYASIKYLQKHISLNCQDHFPPTKKFLEFQKKQHSDFEMSKNEKKVEKKIIRCHLCPKICSSIHGWRRHMSETHEDAGFSKLSNTCIICNELVYGYKALEKHLLQNHAEDSGLPVEEEDNLVKEALTKSTVDLTTYRKAGKNTTEIYQDDEGNYHCPHCSKVHSDLKALRTHIKIHVNMKLECSICQKTFKNPTLLKQHVQRHRKDAVYTCDTCDKKFLTLQKLNKHRKVHHNTGNFVCELCGMAFALNDYLQKHKKCHTDKRPHGCTVCGKTFRTKPELRVHVLIHTRETPYKCQYCGRGFSQKGNYRIHLAQHTGEKPYHCDQCEISFALLCHLKRHKATHDQKVNYRCIWCDKECTQRKHMQMHVQRIHKEDFYQYEEQMKLETPIPIAPAQAKLYNRRLGKVNKVRRQYRTKAQKCNSTLQQLLNGVVSKTEIIEDMETSEDIVIEPLVEHMIKTSHETGGYEILVSDDHQNYAKHSIPAELIGQDNSNLEIVMGENNEIIIINDPSRFHEVISDSMETGSIHIHESVQHAVEAFVNQAKGLQGVQDGIIIEELDKNSLA